MIRNALSATVFKGCVNELIGNYFYMFSVVYNHKMRVPTNREMLSAIKTELDCLCGFKVNLSETQKYEFEKIFTREYNLIMKEHCA